MEIKTLYHEDGIEDWMDEKDYYLVGVDAGEPGGDKTKIMVRGLEKDGDESC